MGGSEHHDMLGRYASFGVSKVLRISRQQEWIEHFGTADKQWGHWKFAILDGCMLHVTCPDEELGGLPMKKPYCIMANFAVDALELRCKEGIVRLLPEEEYHGEQPFVAQVAPSSSA